MTKKSHLGHSQEADYLGNPFLEVEVTKPPSPPQGKQELPDARKGPSNHPFLYPKGNLPRPNITVQQ